MFAHCCGHATIVAWQQPLFGLIRCRCACQLRSTSPSKGPVPPIGHNRATEFSPTLQSPPHTAIAPSDRIQQRPTRCRESHKHDSHDVSSARSSDHRHCALRSHDVRHPSCSKRIASFLCGRHFLRQFSSRHDAACDMRAENGFIFHTRQNNVVRNLSQRFLTAVGNEARA
jgi:hypothetical protein